MERKKYIQNDIVSLEEYLDTDCRLLYESWYDADTIIGYNYKLPYSFEEYREQCKTNSTWGAAIIKRLQDNVIIGRIGISPGLPDLTITIFKPYRNQGYGVMAFSLAVKYCFEVLNFDEIYAGCFEDNYPSLKMIEKCGFTAHPEGNAVEKHIVTGENRMQYDFVIKNPRHT